METFKIKSDSARINSMQENAPQVNKTIPQLEDEILKFWKDHKIFEKSVEKNSPDNLYVFYDGPPFISGLPHWGHLLCSIAKDVFPRYFTMKGRRVERVWGWDAHGITVENKVQQKLGIKNRRDIEKFGIEEFIKECYKYTSETSDEWEWYIDRIGRWVDLKSAYKTTDQSYMETVIWVFKQLYDKGYIYEGVRTSLYCTTCGTPVSNFEIAMDDSYRDMEDPSIIVKFPVITKGKFAGVNILAWTTTPWTIPSNRGLVVEEKANYVLVESGGEKYIVAEPRIAFSFLGKEYKIMETFLGSELIGLEYSAPYNFFKASNKDFKVYSYEGMVSMDDGTGIVHSAPGFGEIDTDMGNHYGLTLMMTLDDEGKFIEGNHGNNPYYGKYYADSNQEILKDLTERKLLFYSSTIVHRFPYHDRCGTSLIQKAQNSWFIKVSAAKEALLKNNQDVHWVPENCQQRFNLNIEQAPDWCISRSRFWGTPMPVWQAADGERIIISSKAELEKLSGQKVKDFHRPYIDEITIKKEGKEFKRLPEVLDSWMESGSMPYAQFHYPFENKEKFENNFPGDFITEYVGQIRAWFHVMHIISTMISDSNSFKNVVVSGVMAGSDGRKMSKTFGNYSDPKKVINDYGGDAIRLYFMGSPLMVADNANFDEDEIKTNLRNVLNPLWNSLKFFLIYANQFGWGDKKYEESDHILDRWIVARTHQLIKEISENLSSYLLPPATRSIGDFVDDLSRWYVRRSRERISSGDNQSLSTLFFVLCSLAKAAAPIIPFITENIYQSLLPFMKGDNPESVHLCEFPVYDDQLVLGAEESLKNMSKAREVASAVLSLRTMKGVGVRQPLASFGTTAEWMLPPEYQEIVKEEVNIKRYEVLGSINEKPEYAVDEKSVVAVNFTLDKELKLEGRLRDFIREIQDLRKKESLSVSDRIKIVYQDNPENRELVQKYKNEIKKKVLADAFTAGLETKISK